MIGSYDFVLAGKNASKHYESMLHFLSSCFIFQWEHFWYIESEEMCVFLFFSIVKSVV